MSSNADGAPKHMLHTKMPVLQTLHIKITKYYRVHILKKELYR